MIVALEEVRFVNHVCVCGLSDTHFNVNKHKGVKLTAIDIGVVVEVEGQKDAIVPYTQIKHFIALHDMQWIAEEHHKTPEEQDIVRRARVAMRKDTADLSFWKVIIEEKSTAKGLPPSLISGAAFDLAAEAVLEEEPAESPPETPRVSPVVPDVAAKVEEPKKTVFNRMAAARAAKKANKKKK